MTKGKHTPGPWKASKGGPNGCPVVGSERGLMVCMLSHSVNIPSHVDQAKANAYLIATAPEMLEAMRKASQLASIASDWNLYEVEIDGEMVGICDLMAVFDAAIAKATGEQP